MLFINYAHCNVQPENLLVCITVKISEISWHFLREGKLLFGCNVNGLHPLGNLLDNLPVHPMIRHFVRSVCYLNRPVRSSNLEPVLDNFDESLLIENFH